MCKRPGHERERERDVSIYILFCLYFYGGSQLANHSFLLKYTHHHIGVRYKKIFAIEKNANAIVTLRNIQKGVFCVFSLPLIFI